MLLFPLFHPQDETEVSLLPTREHMSEYKNLHEYERFLLTSKNVIVLVNVGR